MDLWIRVDFGRDCDRIVEFHRRGEVPMGDQDRDRSTQRFRSGWIQLENYVLLDLAGDLDPHVDLNNELDPGSDLGSGVAGGCLDLVRLELHIFVCWECSKVQILIRLHAHADSKIHVSHTCDGIKGKVCTRKGSKLTWKACLTNCTQVSKHWWLLVKVDLKQKPGFPLSEKP